MRFCCGVTLYYPSINELVNIVRYKEIFECVFLFDNTDDEDIAKNNQSFFFGEGFVYLSNIENEGLSVSFNTMCRKAIYDAYDYICLFDQDSIISNKDLIIIIDYIRANSSNTPAMYVPEIIYTHEKTHTYCTLSDISGVEINWAISSGSFINLYIHQQTEGFDENYFIDRLDYDYCIVLRNLGYKVIKVKNVFLFQALGEPVNGTFRRISQHSPLRHYYIFRNRLYYYFSKNKPTFYSIVKCALMSFYHITLVILFENNKNDKIRMMLRGGFDFYRNKMGKYNPGYLIS